MTIKLNHTIVAAHNHQESALFLSELLGLEPPVLMGPFAIVKVGGEGLTLDFLKTGGNITSQHYAFLVSEAEFDTIFARIKTRELPYWADPYRTKRGHINHWDDGRGVYFEDPNGHLLEILTRPYGSAGTLAENPHPLVAEKLERYQSDSAPANSGASDAQLACAEQPAARKG